MANYDDIKKKAKKSVGKSSLTNTKNGGNASDTYSSIKSRVKEYGTSYDIDDEFISKFNTDSSAFLKDAGTSINDYSYSAYKSGSKYKEYLDRWSDINERAKYIRAYMNSNRGNIGEDSYTGMTSYLDEFDKASRQYLSGYRGYDNYYSKFKSEDDYTRYNIGWLNTSKDVNTPEKLKERQNYYNSQVSKIADLEEQIKTASGEEKKKLQAEKERLVADNNQYMRRQKILDDNYAITLNSDFAEDSKKRYYRNPTKEQLDEQDLKREAFDDSLSARGFVGIDENGNYILGDNTVVKAPEEPEIPDKLGAYLSATDQDIIDAYARMSASNGNYARTWDKLMQEGDTHRWNLLDKNEISIYYYLYENKGQEAAYKFLDDMDVELGRRETEKLSKEYNDPNSTGLLKKIAYNAASVPATVFGGLPGFISDVASTIKGEEINPYSAAHRMQNFSNVVRSNTANDINEAFGNASLPILDFSFGDAYQALMSGADSLFGGAVFGRGFTLLMGTSAASSTAQDLYERGASNTQIALGSLSAGVFETLFEYVSLDKLLSTTDTKRGRDLVKQVLIQGGVEATEEMCTEVANTISEAINMRSQSEWGKLYNEGGFKKAFNESLKNVVNSGLGGFISGGAMALGNSGVKLAMYNNQMTQYGKNLYNSGAIDTYTDYAKNNDIGNDGKKLLNKVNNANSESVGISANDKYYDSEYRSMGKLADTIDSQTFENATKAEIKARLESEGVDASTKMVNAVYKQITTDSDIKFGSKEAKQLAKKITSDETFESSIARRAVASNMQMHADHYTRVAKESAPQNIEDSVKDKVSETNESTIESTGEQVEIKKISSIENGKMNLELSDGSIVSSNDILYSSTNQALAYESALELGCSVESANAIVDSVKSLGNESATKFLLGVKEAYRYGVVGQNLGTISKNGFAADLTETQRKFAYDLGRNDAGINTANAQESVNNRKGTGTRKGKVHLSTSVKSLTDRQRVSVSAVGRVIADITHNDVVFYESVLRDGKRVFSSDIAGHKAGESAPNGFYNKGNGAIYIDIHAGNNGEGAILFTAAHELTHFVHQWSPEKFKTLADFLVEEYGKQGTDVHQLILNQIAKAKKNGRTLSFDDAFEEVVADSMETMFTDGNLSEKLAKLKAKDQTLWEKIKSFFTDLLAKIKGEYENLDPQTEEGRLVKQMKDSIEQISDLFAEALVDAGETFSSVDIDTVNNAGLAFDAETQTVFSQRYSTASDNISNVDRDELINSIMNLTNRSKEEVESYLRAEEAAALSIKGTFLDFEGNDKEVAIKNNSDYPQGTIDLTNICTKRVPVTMLTNRLQEALPNDLFTADDYADIRLILMDDGRIVACGLCFVEDRRQYLGEIAKDFIDEWNKALKNGGNLKRLNSSNQVKDVKIGDDLAKRYGVEPGLITPTQVTFRQDMFASSENWFRLQKTRPDIAAAFEAFNNARGQSAGRLLLDRAEYKREILNWSPEKVKKVNDVGGLRIFSFSDFEVVHLVDLLQIIEDCAAMGVKIQGYTKQTRFAKLVSQTGLKLNRSFIPYGATGIKTVNGKKVLSIDTVEGINNEDADFVDETNNPNVGNNITGINDEQIHIAMKDNFFHYIIPFHTNKKGSANKKLGVSEWRNYKLYQTDKTASSAEDIKKVFRLVYQNKQNGMSDTDAYDKALKDSGVKFSALKEDKMVNIYTEVLPDASVVDEKSFLEKYLSVCEERDIVPRYPQFLNLDENGKFMYTEGYTKFLVDFKLFNYETGEILPQGLITPTFDSEYINSIIADELSKTERERKGQDYPEELYNDILNYIKVKHGYNGDKKSYNKYKKIINDTVAKSNRDVDGTRGMSLSPSAQTSENQGEMLSDRVTDKETLEFLNRQLERGEVTEVYRAMAVGEDGKLYPPMAGYVRENGKKVINGSPSEYNVWEQSRESIPWDSVDENSLLDNGFKRYENPTKDYPNGRYEKDNVIFYQNKKGEWKAKFHLDKDNGTVVDAAYAPYIHTSLSMLNDQFTSAYTRDNLVVVRGYVPNSEVYGINGTRYQANFADKPVGKTKWHSGVVAAQMPETRTVILSRYFMPIEIVDDSVMAQAVKDMMKGKDIEIPFNVVTPSQRRAMEAIGIRIGEARGLKDAPLKDSVKYSDRDSDGNTLSKNQQEFFKDSKIRDEDGNLLVVYHGTSEDFTVFDRTKSRANMDIQGSFFSPWDIDAGGYGGNVGAYYLNIKNPASEAMGYKALKKFKGQNSAGVKAREYLENLGYDGVNNGGEEYIAFYPEQIKRIDNENPTSDPDIRYSDRVLMGSLFSGGGTLEAGLVYQMVDKQFAVESNKKIASVYTDNNGNEHMFVGDVRDFESKSKDSVFYLHASPVCKNFSAAKVNGGETTLDIVTAKATARILEEQMPQVFTVENVKRYKGSEAYGIIVKKLIDLGYKWDVDVYNSADYGAATSRERLIIRAVKDGELPAKPKKIGFTPWFDAVSDIVDDLPEAPMPKWMKDRYEAGNYNTDQPLFILGGNKGYRLSTAYANEPAPTLLANSHDARIVMPDGRVLRATPRVLARIQGLPDSYNLPKQTTLAYTVVGNGIPTQLTKAVMGGVLDSAYEQTHNGNQLYSERNTDSIDSRTLLANALESTAQNDIEKKYISQYQEKISTINKEQEKLTELRSKIKELSFAKGHRDANQIRKLQEEANKVANRINVFDKQLLKLESTKPLKQVIDREKAMARKKAEKAGREALDAYRERAAQTQRDLMNRYKDRAERAKERRNKTDIRNKIKGLVEELKTRDFNPKVNRYIPMSLIKPTNELLSLINLDSGRSEKLSEKLALLKTKYDEIANDPKYSVVYDEVISEMIQDLSKSIGDTSIYQMSTEQLEKTYNTLKALMHTIRTAVKAHNIDTEKNIFEISMEMTDETASVRKESSGTIARWINTQLRPETMFSRLAGFKKDSMWSKVYKMLNDGQTNQMRIEMEANKIFRDVFRDTEYIKSLSGDMVDIGLKDDNGNSVEITRGMMLTIYKAMMNEDNLKHMMVGGITVPDIKKYYKGSDDAYGVGHIVCHGIGSKGFSDLSYQMSELIEQKKEIESKGGSEAELKTIQKEIDDLKDQRNEMIKKGNEYMSGIKDSIESMLTDGDKSFLKATSIFFDEFSKRELNKTTMESYGFEKAQIENYLPIHTDPNFRQASFEQITKDFNLENSGFMKDRVKASNPIMLEDLAELINSQISKVARYCGLMIPVKDFNKIYGKSTRGFESSLQDTIASKFGHPGKKYIDNLMSDIVGSRTTETTFLDRARGYMAGAVLSINPRVALAQAASLPTAASEIGWKPILKSSGKFLTSHDYELIAKYTPLLYNRSKGADVELADIKKMSQVQNRVMKKLNWLMGWIEAMDKRTVGTLWYASQYYVQDKFSDLNVGTEEYYTKVAEVFNNVVERTQPNYSVMQRPDILRNPNAVVKQLTMFMTQRLQNANIIYESASTYKKYRQDYAKGINGVTNMDVKEARGTLARSITSQLVAAAAIVGIKYLTDQLLHNMNAYRDDDKELTAESQSLALLENFIESLIGNFLGGGEMFSVITSILTNSKYYGVTLNGISSYTESMENIVKLAQDILHPDPNMTAKEEEERMNNIKYEILSLSKSVCNMFGIPLGNALKIFNGIRYHIEDFKNGEGWSFEAGVTRNSSQDYGRIYRAILDGDSEEINKMKEKYGSNYTTRVRQALKENDPRIREAAEAKDSGDLSKYMRIAREIKSEGNFSQDDIVTAINYVINDMHKDDPEEEKDKSVTHKGLFTNDDIEYAIENGKGSYMQDITDDFIQTKISNGKSQEDAEKATITAIRNVIRNSFKEGDITYVEAVNALTSYGEMESELANSKVRYWEFEQNNPTIDIDESVVNKYFDTLEPEDISIEVFYDFYERQRGLKQEDILPIIDSMPISDSQKDALWYFKGWSANTIDEKAPWHKP